MATADELVQVTQNEDHVLTVRLQRHVITDMNTTRQIQALLLAAVDQTDPCRGVVIDFRRVRVMSSQFFGVLLQLIKRCKAKGHALVLCRVHPDVRQPITIMKLDRLLKIYDDLPTAVAAVSGH